jgi:hypothetical protein
MKYNVDERWCFILKKFICGLLVGIILTMGVTVSAVPEIKSAVFSPDIKLIVNGEAIDTPVVSVVTVENPGYMTNYVPARAVAEELGATVTWDGKTRTISIDKVKETTEETARETASSTQSISVPQSNADIPFPIYKVDETGLNVYNIHNGYLYGVFVLDVINAVKKKGMVMNYAADGKSMQIVKQGEGIIVSGIIPRAFDGRGYIPYDFFEEKIKPVLLN